MSSSERAWENAPMVVDRWVGEPIENGRVEVRLYLCPADMQLEDGRRRHAIWVPNGVMGERSYAHIALPAGSRYSELDPGYFRFMAEVSQEETDGPVTVHTINIDGADVVPALRRWSRSTRG